MIQKYNILYTSSFSSMQGGGQRSTYLLIKCLNKDKFCPFLVVPEKGELSEEVEKLGVNTFTVSFKRIKSFNIFLIIKDLLKIIKIIRENNIDIIHTESPRQTIYCGIAAKLLKIPLIMHLRVSNSSLWLDKILYFLSDYMIAVSDTAKSRFNAIDKHNKIEVVYNSVDLDEFTPSKEGIRSGEVLKVGYFGRIEERKGVVTLIKAAKLLNTRVKLIIIGNGDKGYLKSLKDLSRGLNVEFIEYKKDIRPEIRAVDVVVLPSLYGEGLSRILIEAMAMGKLVVASDLESNREALGNNYKFFFPPADDKFLALIIDKIAFDKNVLYKMEDKLRKRAEDLFDVRSNTVKIENLYTYIVERKYGKY